MGVIVTNVKRLKRTPKKSAASTKKKVVPKREPAAKPKPETKANNTTPKPKAVKSKPAPKRKTPKKKPSPNNTVAKKEQVNNSAPANNFPERRESSRKRVAPKIEYDLPAKKAAKGKPAATTPAKKNPGRGRPPKANNVISPKKKETPKKTTEKPTENTPVKATNDVKKKQSKPKPAKRSLAKAKKPVATKSPKKTPAAEKSGSSAKVKGKPTGGKAKKGPAAKVKSVYLNPVIELEPIEHFKAMTQGAVINHEEERNPLNKKYQPYMEKIKLLTPEEISNFVRKNKEHYAEKLENTEKNGNQRNSKNSDLKDQFKCHPFNSEQQLAMYLTLREIFNVPKTHFKECRNFFTVLMPEISCQLFAEIFHMKTTSVPKLIKKLYPSAMSPF